MIYFDNASTSFPKPREVVQEMSRFLTESAGNPGRAGYRLSREAQKAINEVRRLLKDFFGGAVSNRFIFTLNDTDALNIAIKGALWQGDHVITTVVEHSSVYRTLWALQKAGIITVTYVACSEEGLVDPDDIADAFTIATRMVIMTHASNVLGTIQPIEEVGRISKERGALFLVDAAQTAGVLPINVREMNIDLLAFPGHKGLLGPPGTGGLYVQPQVTLRPFRHGGTGVLSESFDQPDEMPFHLEAGTLNTVGVVGLGAALKFIQKVGMEAIRAKELHLTEVLLEKLAGTARLTLYGPKCASCRVSTVALNIEGLQPERLTLILDRKFDIASRPGLHCASLLHKQMGTFPDGTLRLSPGFFNTEEEVDTVAAALRKIASETGTKQALSSHSKE